MNGIVFICGANDFHAMDKYWLTAKFVSPGKVLLLTDSIEYVGLPRLIADDFPVHRLFIIDKFVLKRQSSLGNIWRNVVKLLFIPIQLFYLKKFYKRHPNYIFHAIPMYYMILCYLAKIPFVGTPQGSEILVRAFKSVFYRKMAVNALRAAKHVVVDSLNMQSRVYELSGVRASLIKNGFDTKDILKNTGDQISRNVVLSVRGINPLYRIDEILKARVASGIDIPISFVYPAAEEDYKKQLTKDFINADSDLGRLSKPELYTVMKNTLLAISIPASDSSPRSVYECIFAGAIVAATYSRYMDELPVCMRERIYIVDIDDEKWFDKAIEFAKKTIKKPFQPSEAALEMCDQERTIKKVIEKVYYINNTNIIENIA
ncbi:hypothetical protein DBR40_23285 [Pedobacter sp. KBW01]|uniref:glycosyltransferase n=1 Tax=Pedobacter sp. KBW01 TaxID=2153364 RepID=UPI000F5A496B|nr:glycosyltransferase [Pedobacter sp. KBW01]RQO65702.1 hypothetical protein DBR40_23285 [Pedobacter sp. KBW01]